MTRFTPQWLQAGQYAASVDRRLIGAAWPTPASNGCAVTVASGMTVNVAAGTVVVPTGNNTGSVLCTSDAVEQVTLAAAPASGSNRYDLVICQARGNDLDGGANNDFLFTNVTGTAAASPTVPATPANAVALAQVYIPGASASVTAGNIADVRPAGYMAVPSRGQLSRIASIVTPTAQIVANSNAEFGTLARLDNIPIAAGRRTKLSFACQGITSSAALDIFEVRLKEGASVIALQTVTIPATNGYVPCSFFVERLLNAGTYSWQICLSRFSGTGTGGYQAGATSPATLLAEDLGAV